MVCIERSQDELKVALAILRMRIGSFSSQRRIVSASEVVLCWRRAPQNLFIEVVRGRVRLGAKSDHFDLILASLHEIHLNPSASEAELILNGAVFQELSVSSLVRRSLFREAINASISISGWLARYDNAVIYENEGCGKEAGLSVSGRDFSGAPVYYNRVPREDFFSIYSIYFGTDRLLESESPIRFGGFRSNEEVSYGVAEVSIPHVHKEGRVERPWLCSSRRKGNPNKHIVVHDKYLLEPEDWLVEARRFLGGLDMCSASRESEGLLFIHGYNVNFEEALWRSAQLCHDLKFPGLMLCFSWASLGSAQCYPADEETINWSASNLEKYLIKITQELGLSAIHIIAHSMGNRALLTVLDGWRNEPGAAPISQVILAAPDVDCGRFSQLARAFNKYEQVTLYASRRDRAIAASYMFHKYPRAGGANPPLVLNYLSTIDVSSSGGYMFGLGHNYVVEASKVFRDMFYVVRHRHKPDQRAGMLKSSGGYWELV